MKNFGFAFVAALAIPMGLVGFESSASAAPLAQAKVEAIARNQLANARAIHAEAESVRRIANENAELAHKGWTRASQIRHQSERIELDALMLLQDDNQHRAARYCHQAHLEMGRAGQLEVAANGHASWAKHFEQLASQHAAEAARLRAMANSEPDALAKRRILDAAGDLDAAATRDRADATRHLAAEKSERDAASKLRADAETKAREANKLAPNSCTI